MCTEKINYTINYSINMLRGAKFRIKHMTQQRALRTRQTRLEISEFNQLTSVHFFKLTSNTFQLIQMYKSVASLGSVSPGAIAPQCHSLK